jgi:Zn-dependent protease with chaperone function
VLVAVALVSALAALIAALASRGLAARALRLANARPLADGEAEHTKRYIESFALGVGFPTPSIGVVEDRALNGFAIGRRRSCVVCLTTGALALPPDQLDALCAQTITSVANRALPFTCAAADLVMVARLCTRAVWGLLGVLLVSTVIGVPPLLAAALAVAITLLVVCTMPMLALADRAIPRLRDNSARLADLNSVGVTNQPAPLARLLLTAADDRRAIAAPWQIAHLWFDADTKGRPPGGFERRFEVWLDPLEGADPVSLRPNPTVARRTLIERARVLVDMTSGDPDLRTRLKRVERK